jgi:hypothetical protein
MCTPSHMPGVCGGINWESFGLGIWNDERRYMTLDLEQSIVTWPAPALEAESLRIIFVGDDPGYLETSPELSKRGFHVERFDRSAANSEAGAAQSLAEILRRITKPSERKEQPRRDSPVICGRLCLHPATARAFWNDVDVDLTLGEYKVIHLLASNAGQHKTYRLVYDCLHYEGFVAGYGAEGYKANVRSLIKRIRNKFRAIDPSFDAIENHIGFGYCWKVTA